MLDLQQTKRTVTLTLNPSVDKSATVHQVLAEHKLRCNLPKFEPGGGGINVARAINKLGGNAKALYLAGGFTGQLLKDLLNQEGLDQHPIPVESWTRENLIVFEKVSQQQYRFGMPGPTIKPEEWQTCLDQLKSNSADYWVISGSLPPGVPEDVFDQLSSLAKEMNSRLIVDTSGSAFQQALKAGVYLCKPNLRELSAWVDQPIKNELNLEDIVKEIIAQGLSEIVVVSLGAGGALCASAEQTIRLNAPTVPIQSKVGAGDSMVGGLVLGLACDLSLQAAAQLGVAAGSGAVMTSGSELCRAEDVETLYPQVVVST